MCMTKDNPFPGMNPFLERFWPDVHTKLITYIADAIAEQLPAGLKARSEEQVTLAEAGEQDKAYRADVAVVDSWKQGVAPSWQPQDQGTPAIIAAEPEYCVVEEVDEVTERWVEILGPNGKVVTVIEVLSPMNKSAGRGAYQAKCQSYIQGGVNVVEIDLLRGGYHAVAMPYAVRDPKAPYIVCVSRAAKPHQKEYYQTRLTAALPNVRIPLRVEDRDVVLPLQQLVDRCYRMGAYWNENHTSLPNPPLDSEDAAWVAERVKAAGLV